MKELVFNGSKIIEQVKNFDKNLLKTMKKGYLEMAEINLSLSKLYFEIEREAQSYYDDM